MFDDLNLWVGTHACELLAHTGLTQATWNACIDPKGFGQEVVIVLGFVLFFGGWGSKKLAKPTSEIRETPQGRSPLTEKRQIATEMSRLKELLDGGAITQAEFDELRRKLISG